MKEFQHGGDINSFAKELKCDTKDIIDLSSNINFLKPRLKKDFNKIDISSYPKYDKLYKSVSKCYNIKKNQIELFNGGSCAIFTLFKHFEIKTCTIYSPAYLEYKKAAKLFSYKLNRINRFEDIKQEVEKNSLVVFVNPSTPDGRYYNIEKLINYWIKQNCTILIDESFLEFTRKKSAISFLKKYKKLYILKSMTKIYSCAGVRLGIIISSKNNIKKLKSKEPLWRLSSYDMNYIIEVLKNKDFIEKTIKKTKQNKAYLKKILSSYSFIEKIYESDVNFLLLKLKDIDSKTLENHLKKYKIMIRDCSNFDFLDLSFVRVAIKNKSSIKALKKALDKI